MAVVELETDDLKEFVTKLKEASNEANRAFKRFVEEIGEMMLDVLSDAVERNVETDTGKLLKSFKKSADGNVWRLDDDGLSIEVGTNVEYAAWVNDGHWANPQGVERRWIPGQWEGNHFRYDPASHTGMSLSQQWIEGKHFHESAMRILEDMIPEALEEKLNDWLENWF